MTPEPGASSLKLAAQLAERLNEVAPDGFTVTAEDIAVVVSHNGEFVGASEAPAILETVEGIRDPGEAIVTAAAAVISGVQDFIADTSAEPWPGTRDQPDPDVRRTGDQLEMWFGDEDNPVLKLRALDLTTC